MVEVLDNKAVLSHMAKYFDRLSAHGYVGAGTTELYLRYLFLADFVELLHAHITDDDYAKITRLLNMTFSTGNCLLPYPVFCERRTKVSGGVMGKMIPRRTEDTDTLRITENEKLRRV